MIHFLLKEKPLLFKFGPDEEIHKIMFILTGKNYITKTNNENISNRNESSKKGKTYLDHTNCPPPPHLDGVSQGMEGVEYRGANNNKCHCLPDTPLRHWMDQQRGELILHFKREKLKKFNKTWHNQWFR